MQRRYMKLRAAMAEYGYTQSDLARVLLLSARSVSSRFTANEPWHIDEMYKLMNLLRLPHDELHLYFPQEGKPTQAKPKRRHAT